MHKLAFVLQSSEYFQDNETLRELYRTLGQRLFEFESSPTCASSTASAEDPWSNDPPVRQLQVRNSPSYPIYFQISSPEILKHKWNTSVHAVLETCGSNSIHMM